MLLLAPELFTSPLGIGDISFPDRGTVQRLFSDPLDDDETAPVYVDVPGLVDLPCEYAPALSAGTVPGVFQREAQSTDRVLLRLPVAGIEPGMKLILKGVSETRFLQIDDVISLCGGAQTVLKVSPSA